VKRKLAIGCAIIAGVIVICFALWVAAFFFMLRLGDPMPRIFFSVQAGKGVAIDSSWDVYITGYFRGPVDFDPGPAEYTLGTPRRDKKRTPIIRQGTEAFLAKYDPTGQFKWACNWYGPTGAARGNDVAVDGSGSIYVAGSFRDDIDFDPDPAAEEHPSQYSGIFLSKFDAEGQFEWVRTWGEAAHKSFDGIGLGLDNSGNIFVLSDTGFNTDPDPDQGVMLNKTDIALCKFDADGNRLWERCWALNLAWESGYVNDFDIDNNGDIYLAGGFEGSADLDPTDGTDMHSSSGTLDAFLLKLDSGGAFQWAYTWGGDAGDEGNAVAVDPSGNVYITGRFYGAVDCDPGPDISMASAERDGAFVSKFNPGGDFQWVSTWEEGWPLCTDIAADNSGDVYIIGETNDRASLRKYDSNGEFQWARIWGDNLGYAIDARMITIAPSGNIHIIGEFKGRVDFDPGPSKDIHSSDKEDKHYTADAFLSVFDKMGNFLWAHTWGG
jgi:hypothetical protein